MIMRSKLSLLFALVVVAGLVAAAQALGAWRWATGPKLEAEPRRCLEGTGTGRRNGPLNEELPLAGAVRRAIRRRTSWATVCTSSTRPGRPLPPGAGHGPGDERSCGREFNIFQSDVPAHRWDGLARGGSGDGQPSMRSAWARRPRVEQDGKLLGRSFGEEYAAFTTHGGRTMSPVVDGDLVIVGAPVSIGARRQTVPIG